ncbi:MAG: chemotaxis protein CheX [Pirellulales bacterium]|nr:chemotaxis protein CheX [Pirellulales bacterium]
MKVEYINPFISALVNTFDTMLGCPISRKSLSLKSSLSPHHEVSGIVGLSGQAQGTVVLSLSGDVALRAASTMLMTEATEINNDVVDAVGELANMVAGAAKAQLTDFTLSISLPNVITGRGHEVRFPSNVKPIVIDFESPWGPLALEVGLNEVAAPVAV